MADLSDEEIAELRRLDGEAAQAPWEPDGAGLFLQLGDEAVRDVWQGDENKRNEALACATRNALSRLLDEVERRREEMRSMVMVPSYLCADCGEMVPDNMPVVQEHLRSERHLAARAGRT